jgi:CshA-type fibril repeat protein
VRETVRKPAAALLIVVAIVSLVAGAAAAASSAPNATVDWSTGTFGSHSVGIGVPGGTSTTTVTWATVAGSDGVVGGGVQSNSAAVISAGPGTGFLGFVRFTPPLTDPVLLVSGLDPGTTINLGTGITLLDSSNATLNAATGTISASAGATGAADDGFAVRITGTFGADDFGAPGSASLRLSYSNSAGLASSTALTFASPAPVPQDLVDQTLHDTPLTLTPVTSVPIGRTLDPAATRLLDGSTPVTTLSNSDGTYVVDTGTGQITFTPTAGFTGVAAPVTFRVTDSAGFSGTATITITVVPDVGAPLASPWALAAGAVLLVPALLLIRRRRAVA